MKQLLLLILALTSLTLHAQQDTVPPPKDIDTAKIKKKGRRQPPAEGKDTVNITVRDYRIISHKRDTTYLDTTLTVGLEYRHNYLR